jgi:hypothetical protein
MLHPFGVVQVPLYGFANAGFKRFGRLPAQLGFELAYTGISCLLTAWVTGLRRMPEPPAKMMPLRCVIVFFDVRGSTHIV